MSSKKVENHDSSIISNVSFFNTLQNEKKIDAFNYNSKSRKSVEDDSREVIYDYSLTNSSNANQTLHSKNRNFKNKNNETLNDLFKNVRFENEFLNQTVIKVKKINENFKSTLKKPISIFAELQTDYSELDNEVFELYSDYFEKNQKKLISQIDQYKKALDETTNERDEYKDYVESLLKENEDKFKVEMEAKKEKANLVSEKNRLLSKIQSLQKNIDDLTHENEMQRQEFNDICNKITTKNVEMEKENHELREMLSQKEKEISKMEIESILFEIIQNAYDQKAKSQFAEFQTHLSELQTKNDELHHNHKIYKSQTEQKIKEYFEKLQYYRIQEKRLHSSLKPDNSSSEIINTSSSITLKSENIENMTSRKIKLFDDNKGVLKKKIQNWMENFKKKENRPPSVEDRIPIAALYSSSRDAADEGNKNNIINNDGQNSLARFNAEDQRKNNNTSMIEQVNRLNIEDFKKNINNLSMIEPPILSRFSKHERQKVLRNESFAKVQKIKHMTRNSISNNLNNITVDIINKSSKSVSPRKAHLNKMKARHAPNISVQVFDDNESRISHDLKERSLEATQSTKARNLNETMINHETNDDDPYSSSLLSINDLKSSKANDGEENNQKNKLQEILKNKDQQLKKLRQDFLKLKENYEKNNNLLLQTNEKLRLENQHLVTSLKMESSKRKVLHNQLEDVKGKVRVYCRVRPLLDNEMEKGGKSVVGKKDELSLMLKTKNEDKIYNFDACFFESASQESFFEDTKSLIKSALDGYNVCIFAYGQTGSGKTYTMLGDSNNPGIIPQSIEEMYKLIENINKFADIKISVVIFELYMDTLIDLLLSKEKKTSGNIPHLEIKEDVKGNNYISNITTLFVKNKEELDKVIKIGMANRKIGKTDMNEESSRSHLIITISSEIYDRKTDTRTVGKLSLIDLAGSERANKSNLSLKQLNESRGINKSLSALGNVISALTTDEGSKKHIPYRDNKLTMIMKDSLGGTSKTLMVVNISPADFNLEETQNSLYYGMRAKNVNNEQIKNVDSGERLKLNEKLRSLFEENESLKKIIRKLQLNQKEKEIACQSSETVKTKEDYHVLNEIKN